MKTSTTFPPILNTLFQVLPFFPHFLPQFHRLGGPVAKAQSTIMTRVCQGPVTLFFSPQALCYLNIYLMQLYRDDILQIYRCHIIMSSFLIFGAKDMSGRMISLNQSMITLTEKWFLLLQVLDNLTRFSLNLN